MWGKSQRSEDGPTTDRKCTDVAFCLVFLLFWGATGFVTVTSRAKGDMTRVMRPFDGSKFIKFNFYRKSLWSRRGC